MSDNLTSQEQEVAAQGGKEGALDLLRAVMGDILSEQAKLISAVT